MPLSDIERLRKFPRRRAKPADIVNASAFLHQLDAAPRFQRTDQNETVRLAFHQHVQHPVHTVVEINVGSAGSVPLDETARAWARKSMRGFVSNCRVRFYFDDNPGAVAPDQFEADEFARTGEGITLKKRTRNKLVLWY